MKLTSVKPSKKTMRVATVFTGVAASAVAMGQTANAQDAALHPGATHASKHVGRTTRAAVPAVAESGSIRAAYSCNYRNIDHTWVHIWTEVYNVPYQESLVADCYGGKGTYLSPRGHGAIGMCGGENHGFLTGTTSGEYWVYDFTAGTKYIPLSKGSLYAIDIEGWAGPISVQRSSDVPVWWVAPQSSDSPGPRAQQRRRPPWLDPRTAGGAERQCLLAAAS